MSDGDEGCPHDVVGCPGPDGVNDPDGEYAPVTTPCSACTMQANTRWPIEQFDYRHDGKILARTTIGVACMAVGLHILEPQAGLLGMLAGFFLIWMSWHAFPPSYDRGDDDE